MPATKTSKEEILEKSLQLIWERGYYQSSFSELSKACGIRHAHFYYYFKDKEDLMSQVLQAAHRYFKEKVFSIAYNESADASVRLETMLRKLKVLYTKNFAGCLFGNTVLEAAHADQPFLDVVKLVFKDFVAALKHLFMANLDEQAAELKAIQTFQQVQGALVLTRLFKDTSYILDTLKTIKV